MRRLNPEKELILGKNPCIVLTDDTTNLQKSCQTGNWLILLAEHPQHFFPTESDVLSTLKKSTSLRIESYFLAEHSDSRNTTQLIHNLRPQHIIFVHGSPSYLGDLTSLEELQNRYQLHSPNSGTLVELPLGEQFIQPVAPSPTFYEGELNEQGSSVNITLPDTITNESRWSRFADTGLVEARWQGEELVLRGISQRELLNQSNIPRRLEDVDCCQLCIYYRNQLCLNDASPLYGFKVTPEGYCPVFEASE
jgi:hypothetical protein